MPQVAFWNTQRNPKLVNPVTAGAWPTVDVLVAAEVLSEPDVKRARQAPRRDRMQLGYRLVSPEHDGRLHEVPIPTYSDITGTDFWIAGGNEFSKQSIRDVVEIEVKQPDIRFSIYAYHANSSQKGAPLVAWITAHLCTQDNEFILLGDFNCSPDKLMDALTYVYATSADRDNQRDMIGL